MTGADVIIVGAGPAGLMLAADVHGPEGPCRVTARYLAGCDGAHSAVRGTAGIPFPGTTYPEVNRLGQVSLPDSVTPLDNGDLEVPGLGQLRAGFTRTAAGVFGFGALTSGNVLIQTTEDQAARSDDRAPMTLTEFQASIRRVLGADLPLGDLSLRTSQGATSVAELMRTARTLLLDLADRPSLREAARDWRNRIDIHTAETDCRPADALLIRPDAVIAWAAASGESAGTAAPALRKALSCLFGTPDPRERGLIRDGA